MLFGAEAMLENQSTRIAYEHAPRLVEARGKNDPMINGNLRKFIKY